MQQENNSEQPQSKRRRQKDSQNSDFQRQDNDDPINCPLIFKACLLTLLTAGMLAFVIDFATNVQTDNQLYLEDLVACPFNANVLRLSKTYAYEKMILGLSISGLVLAFGLALFMIRRAYDFCRCFDDCCGSSSEDSSSSSSQEVDMDAFEIELKKRVTSNILRPKAELSSNNTLQFVPKRKSKQKQPQQQNSEIRLVNPHIRKYLKTPQQIAQLQKKYGKQSLQSDQCDCDCECQNCGQCLGVCFGFVWCRTCFDAHLYHFYRTKNEQYAYWIIYMVKTLLFGTALAYVIRLQVSLKDLDYCTTDNGKKYAEALNVAMIIGIVTAVVDVFGYIHLLVEGSLLELVEDTLKEKQKSEHSEADSESESDEDDDDNDKKKSKKYRDTSQEQGNTNVQNKKSKSKIKVKKQSIEDTEQQNDFPQKQNIFKSLSKQKQKQPKQLASPSIGKDTDSFFIKLRTLRNQVLESGQDQSQQSRQSRQKLKKKSPISQSQQSYEPKKKDQKPEITIPKSIQKQLKKKERKQQESQTSLKPEKKVKIIEESQKQIQFQRKNRMSMEDNDERSDEQVTKTKMPTTSFGKTKFGGFNSREQQEKKQQHLPNSKGKQPQINRVSKFSTKF